MSPDEPRWSTSAVRISFISKSCPCLPRRRAERKQRHLAGVLDRDGDVALVLHTVTGHAAGTDLAAFADVGAQQRGVLVVDRLPLLGAEDALTGLDRLFGRGAPLGGLRHVCISFWVLLIESGCQKGGSSSLPENEPDAGALPHGSSCLASPPAEPPPREPPP